MDYDPEKLVAVLLYAAITWYLAPYAAKQAGVKDELVGITGGFVVSLYLFQQYIQK